MTTPPKRRWFQFSLRTVLVVMTLFCIGPGGYVAYEQNKARREMAAVEVIEKLGGSVSYDPITPVRSATMRQILGDESFGDVSEVWLGDTQVTDAGLVHLADLTNLDTVVLYNTKVTNAGLVHLDGLQRLAFLALNNTQVTDAGLVHVAELKNLSFLALEDTQVTDAGLVHLTNLTKLETLWLNDTQVTDAGIAELQKALPGCAIDW